MTSNVAKNMVAIVSLALGMMQMTQGQTATEIKSPDGLTVLRVRLDPGSGRLSGAVLYDGSQILPSLSFGITRQDQAFVDGLKLVEAGSVKTIDETYTMLSGKRKTCRHHANERTLAFANADGAKVELIVRAYDDGVAFRYRFPETSSDKHVVTSEATAFRLPDGGRMWAHPYDRPSKYTPAYETYYVNGVDTGTPSPIESGWAFPVLFCTPNASRWGLITEAGLDPSYCGTRLTQKAADAGYAIRFPDEGEGDYTGRVEPS